MMHARTGLLTVAIAAGLAAGAALPTAQSLSYSSGQNVSPAYEGWEEDATGARHFVFGYMNRNWQEELDVPVGPDNSFNLGPADQGQPTHFLPRRNRFVFRVAVPSGFTAKDEFVWTLTTRGKIEKAYATLSPDYKIDDVVRASETGALGAGTSSPEVRANTRPILEVPGRRERTVKAGDTLTLNAVVVDDGIPKRRGSGLSGAAVTNEGSRRDDRLSESSAENPVRINRAMLPPARATVGKNVGLHVTWYVYRGQGRVTFSPDQVMAWEDTRTGANSPWAPIWEPPPLAENGRTSVQVTFHDPGTYVLRSHADDGALTTDEQVTVVVTPR